MLKEKQVPVALIDASPANPRKHFEGIETLASNLGTFGQLVAVILVSVEETKRFVCVDGERRLRAAKLAGIAELRAVVLEKHPSPGELLAMQASLTLHSAGLRRSEQCGMLAQLLTERGCTVTELCTLLSISQSFGSKLLRIHAAHPDVLAAVDAGTLGLEEAYIISTEADHAKQHELVRAASGSSRETLRKKVRGPSPANEPKVSAARFAMPGGYQIALRGPEMTLETVIEVLVETVRQLRKGLSQNLDVKTQERVMADTLKTPPKSRSLQPVS